MAPGCTSPKWMTTDVDWNEPAEIGVAMAMRSTLDIIIAVKECQPVSEQELRLAVVALSAMESMDQRALRDLAECVVEGKPSAKLKAQFLLQETETRFKSRKMPVDQYLGPGDIPGTPENSERLRVAKAIYKKATGEVL